MMRITVGVDNPEVGGHVLDLIQALGFTKPTLDLSHVVERWDETSSKNAPGAHLDLIKRYLKMQEDEGEKILESTFKDASSRGFARCEKHLLLGHISNKLVDHTLAHDSALLALGSSGKTRFEGILVGSVTRKSIISSPRSVLVVKTPLDKIRPLTIVVATDHSPYADSCLKKLAAWAPTGISRLILVTVFPEELIRAMNSVMEHFKADTATWLREELHGANHRALKAFEDQGYTCTSRVESGPVGNVLARVMEEEKADLLVVGAQGHGFIDRLTMGSVSLDQAVRRPYSVLVMRT